MAQTHDPCAGIRHLAQGAETLPRLVGHRILHINFLFIFLVLLLLACESKRKDTVWELYDIRHPVPAESAVPLSRATTYDRSSDYDAYYTPPKHETCALHNYSTLLCK